MIDTSTAPSPNAKARKAVFWKGIALVWGYMIVGAAGEVYAASAFQSIDFYTTLSISFALIAVVFNAMAWVGPQKVSGPAIVPFLILNMVTMAAWLGLFIGLKHAEPAIVVSLMVAIGPLTTLLINRLVRRSALPPRIDVVLSLLIAAVGAYLIFVQIGGRAGSLWTEGTAFGLMAATVAGVGLAATAVLVKRLYDLNVNGRVILAHRFYLVLILLLFLVDYETLQATLLDQTSQAFIIAVTTVIVPILLIQAGIKLIEPITVEFMLCASPLVTFAVQLLDSRLSISGYTLIGNVAIVAIALWSVGVHQRRAASGS